MDPVYNCPQNCSTQSIDDDFPVTNGTEVIGKIRFRISLTQHLQKLARDSDVLMNT
jgi:hypothetical protein